MNLRKCFLRVMLASLALTAVSGVYLMLLGEREFPEHILATTFLTAVAAGLMVPVSWLLERDNARPAGMVGTVAVLVDYILILVAIWADDASILWADRSLTGDLLLTSVFVGLCSAPAVLCLLLFRVRNAKWPAVIGVVASGIALAEFLTAVWLPREGNNFENWFVSGWATVLFAPLLMSCMAVAHKRVWPWLGVVASLGAWVLMTGNAFVDDPAKPFEVAFAVLATLAVVTAHANLSLFLQLTRRQKWMRWATIGLTLLTGAMVDGLIVADIYGYETPELLGRIAAACGIVAGCGTVSLLVLAVMNRMVEKKPESSSYSDITIICPECGTSQSIPVGDGTCYVCKLRFHIRTDASDVVQDATAAVG